jgi:hypothetical protein
MSFARTENPRVAPRQGEEWRAGYPPPGRSRDYGGPPLGLVVTGLVVVGLGVMAWYYLGPDLRRYLKIEQM